MHPTPTTTTPPTGGGNNGSANAPAYDDLYENDKPPPSYFEAISSGPPPPYLENRPTIPGTSVPLSSIPRQSTQYLRSPANISSTSSISNATITSASQQPNLNLPIMMNDVCPICQGALITDFPFLCWVLALCWFPIGVLCCLMSARKRCDQCGLTYG